MVQIGVTKPRRVEMSRGGMAPSPPSEMPCGRTRGAPNSPPSPPSHRASRGRSSRWCFAPPPAPPAARAASFHFGSRQGRCPTSPRSSQGTRARGSASGSAGVRVGGKAGPGRGRSPRRRTPGYWGSPPGTARNGRSVPRRSGSPEVRKREEQQVRGSGDAVGVGGWVKAAGGGGGARPRHLNIPTEGAEL